LYSLHAEYNWVPTNLCVAVPPSVKIEHAAFTTVGAIAMHGFRQAEARLGEISCVIGLGLVGQILVQILRAAGVHVFGIDVLEDRARLAEQMGANAAAVPQTPSFDSMLKRIAILARGAGADHIFIAAGGPTNEPVKLATKLARDRARIIDIGKCKLDLPWKE